MIIISIRRSKKPRPRVQKDLVNNSIQFSKVAVIDENGNNLGIMSKYDAINRAETVNLDLLCVSPTAKPPVCKILDYGRYKYEKSKKNRETKKTQTIIEVKEIRITPLIGQHDLETKAKQARQFITDGNRVKVSLKFRGREITMQEKGRDTLKRFIEILNDVARLDVEPKLINNRFLDVYLIPLKSKK